MTSPRRLIIELAEKASWERLFSNNESYLRRCHYEGKVIPDELLPGRFIMKLPEEKRDILKNLKSDDIKDLIGGESELVWSKQS